MTIRNANGLALIDVVFVCGIMGILTSIAIPRLLGAKQAAGAASAIGSLRAMTSAELTFALSCGSGFYAPNLTTLGTAPPGSNEGFISPGLTGANVIVKSNYRFVLQGTPYNGAPASCNGLGPGEAGQGYKASADPVGVGASRFFGTNSNALIYEDVAAMFDAFPEVGEPTAGAILH